MLPHELISAIIDACRLDLPSLVSWAQVSTVFLPIARKHLYNEITFAGYWRSNTVTEGPQNHRSLDWSRASQLLDTITASSHLALLVQDLTLALRHGTWPAALWAWFLGAFPSMTQLESLNIDLGMFTPSLERIFRDTSMKLRELGLFMHSSPLNTEYLVQLLNQQEKLEILSLVGVAWQNLQLSADACLRLHTISTSSRRFIEDIVTGRPVVKLCWDLSDPALHGLYPDMWKHSETSILARALSQIRILTLHGLGDSGWLALITPYLDSLEVLDLNECHERNFKELVKLKELKVIVFRTGTVEQRQGTLIKPLFLSMLALRLAFFRFQSMDQYSKWARGARVPVGASSAEIASFLKVTNLGEMRNEKEPEVAQIIHIPYP